MGLLNAEAISFNCNLTDYAGPASRHPTIRNARKRGQYAIHSDTHMCQCLNSLYEGWSSHLE